MLFMAKSALCIGIVATVAAGSAGGGTIRATLETSGREAAASLGRACAASKDCVGLGTRIAASALGQPGTVPGAARTAEALAPLDAPDLSASALATGRSSRRVERSIHRPVVARD